MALARDGRVTSGADIARPRVDVIFDGPPASRTLEVLALKEARLIWAAYGIDVGALRPRDCESASAVRITVTFGTGPARGMAVASLGSIRFLDGVPEPAIVLYPDTIAALVSATPSRSFIVDAPSALRDLVLGRALGRALAHEIGHFLLRSQQHSTVGLMRALQPTTDLVDPNRHRFALSDGDRTRLAVTAASLPQPRGLLSCAD
jgi:hypothetical protein